MICKQNGSKKEGGTEGGGALGVRLGLLVASPVPLDYLDEGGGASCV